MESITVARELDADPEAVRAAMSDLDPFMAAAGFDEVNVTGDTIELANAVMIMTIELTLELVDEPEVHLAYEQREGIFDEMVTKYVVEPQADGCRIVATTEFAMGAAFAGPLLDATIIKRQRSKELLAQFNYLEDVTN